jgi:hypothetical protein
MKNTLAENMLRFGVKNLKESDVKRLERAKLDEIYKDDNGVVYKYPFKDANQFGMYSNLLKVNPESIAKSMGYGPYDDPGDFRAGISAIHRALFTQTAKDGIFPGTLSAEKAKTVINNFIASPTHGLDANALRAVSNVIKTPQFNKYYTSYWLPMWKNAYIKTFGQLPTATPNPQAPGAPQQ